MMMTMTTMKRTGWKSLKPFITESMSPFLTVNCWVFSCFFPTKTSFFSGGEWNGKDGNGKGVIHCLRFSSQNGRSQLDGDFLHRPFILITVEVSRVKRTQQT